MTGLAGSGQVIHATNGLVGEGLTKALRKGVTAICVSSNKICGRYVPLRTFMRRRAGRPQRGDRIAALARGGGPMRVMETYHKLADCDLVCFGEVVTRDLFLLMDP